MIVSNPSVFHPETPAIDASETRWVSRELATIIAQLGPDSAVGMVLRNARREVNSLSQSATATVVGPFRIAA